MHIMVYTKLYPHILRIRLEPSCEPVLTLLHACAAARLPASPTLTRARSINLFMLDLVYLVAVTT
jgi:hypothetical protein